MIKKIFDFFSALIGLVALSPFLIFIALLIKLDSKGPVFFRQRRVGCGGRIFYTYKFRTMTKKTSENQEKVFTIGEDKRVTRIGKFLRKRKLDELPQLINILKGEMSLVGPRPEIPKFVAFFTKEQREKIFSVKPGMTSLASIKFNQERDILSKSADPENNYIHKILPEKLALDMEYIKKQSFLLDLLLIIRTIKKIFIR